MLVGRGKRHGIGFCLRCPPKIRDFHVRLSRHGNTFSMWRVLLLYTCYYTCYSYSFKIILNGKKLNDGQRTVPIKYNCWFWVFLSIYNCIKVFTARTDKSAQSQWGEAVLLAVDSYPAELFCQLVFHNSIHNVMSTFSYSCTSKQCQMIELGNTNNQLWIRHY